MMPDWFLTGLPFLLIIYPLFFLGIGLPWALALLPRADWQDKPTVLGTGLALGPLLGTTWLFVMGQFATFDLLPVLAGLMIIALVGAGVAWQHRVPLVSLPPVESPTPLSLIEKLVLAMIGVGFLVMTFFTMYWPFIYYDTLWTYGYNARVFYIFNEIPDFIQYYPKFSHLTYTFGHLVYGGIDDHVVRMAIPWFILSSIMMAYLLGRRVWGKRSIGIFTAAFWLLNPPGFYWTFSGDLEHTVTIYFTGATVFLILAWRSGNLRYALLSGLMLGGAMWTKPTAGAWILGAVLLFGFTVVYLLGPAEIRRRFPIPSMTPTDGKSPTALLLDKFSIMVVVGLTCIPIGGMWYLRNLLLDHQPIRLPPDYWNDLAQRSGKQFTWIILMAVIVLLIALAGYLFHKKDDYRVSLTQLLMVGAGFVLLLAGTVPNALNISEGLNFTIIQNFVIGEQDPRGYLNLIEIVLILLGLGLIIAAMRPFWRQISMQTWSTILLTTLLILPFTIVWFMSFSYQHRLMLSIVPVLAAMVAALTDYLVRVFPWDRRILSSLLMLGVVGVSLLGPIAMIGFTVRNTLADGRTTDEEKYAVLGESLLVLRDAINERYPDVTPNQKNLVMYTFNEHRLQFYFPWMSTIEQWEVPTRFDELENTPDLLIGGSKAEMVWQLVAEEYPNQISGYMHMSNVYADAPLLVADNTAWTSPLELLVEHEDTSHHLFAYVYHPESHETTIADLDPAITLVDTTWEGIGLRGMDMRYAGDNSRVPFEDGHFLIDSRAQLYVQLYWQRTGEEAVPADYQIVLAFTDETGDAIFAEHVSGLLDAEPANEDIHEAENALLMSKLPYPDLVPDRHVWTLPAELETGTYTLRLGLQMPGSGEGVPVINSDVAFDDVGLLFEDVIVIVEPEA